MVCLGSVPTVRQETLPRRRKDAELAYADRKGLNLLLQVRHAHGQCTLKQQQHPRKQSPTAESARSGHHY